MLSHTHDLFVALDVLLKTARQPGADHSVIYNTVDCAIAFVIQLAIEYGTSHDFKFSVDELRGLERALMAHFRTIR